MLQKSNLLTSFILLMMLFAGCSKEQTSMSIEDIRERAKIIGNLCYNEGQRYEGGNIVDKISPAANKRILIEVSNASLSPTGTAQGNTTFTTMTDKEGNYSIEIPVAAKSQGTVITIKAETFEGTQSVLKSLNQPSPEFETKKGVYSYAGQTEIVKPNETIVCNMMYQFTERETVTTIQETVELKAKIGVGKLRKSSYYDSEYYIDVQPGISVIVSVTDYNNGINENSKRNYGGVTNNKGEVTIKIPVKEKPCILGIELHAITFAVNDFIYYGGSSNTISYKGSYKQFSNGVFKSPINLGDIMLGGPNDPNTILKSIMVFEQSEDQPYGYNYRYYNWSNIVF